MKLLIKNKKSMKCSNQKSEQARKAAKPARVISIRPVDEAKAHRERVQDHLKRLQTIQAAYAESTAGVYGDSKASLAEKKSEIRKNCRQLGASLGEWHDEAIELMETGSKLRSNLKDLHAELARALAYFAAPQIN